MAEKKYPENVDKIQDYVTRPREGVVDITGNGNYNLSPLGFPDVNYSGNSNPTRIVPNFSVTYKDAKFFDYYDNSYKENDERGIIRKNKVDSGTINSIFLDSNSSSINDFYKDYTVKITDGLGKGQNRTVVSYNGITKELVVDSNWSTIPDSSSVYLILIRQNTAQSGTSNSITLDGGASSDNGFYDSYVVVSGEETQVVYRFIRIIEGTGKGQVRFLVSDIPGPTYNGTTKELFVTEDWDTIPDNTSVFVILETHPYKWDGTETENKIGVYESSPNNPIIDPVTGEEITHLRKGYSSDEVSNKLKELLGPSIDLGKNNGTLFNWLFGKSYINIGGGGSKEVFVDSFGINRHTKTERTFSNLDLSDKSLILQQREKIAKRNRYTRWVLSNTQQDHAAMENKSPFVKDYPNVYNSESVDELPGTAQSGGAASITLDANSKEIADFFVSSILTITAGTGVGQVAVLTSYDEITKLCDIDLIKDNGIDIEDSNPNTPWNIIPDNTSQYTISVMKEGGNLPVSVDIDSYRINVNLSSTPNLRPFTLDNNFYLRDNGYHNNITLDLSDDNMYGRHHISILHKLYLNDNGTNLDILDELDEMYLNGVSSPGTDPHIIRRVPDSGFDNIDDDNDGIVDRNIVKYYYKRRKKYSINNLVASPAVPASDELQYTDGPGANDVTIHLVPGTNDLDVVFTNTSKTQADIRLDLLQNNDMIPDVINSGDYNHELEMLFVHNDAIDPADSFYEQLRSRSKKTFVHLPTKNIEDGQILELDVSLPKEFDTPSFVENTIGVISGYRNYISQPRLYVFSGYQVKTGNNCNLDVGLTEKKNPYLFSTLPEIEFSNKENANLSSNIFHQNIMREYNVNGNRFIKILSFVSSGYVDADESDIGKIVLGGTSSDEAILLNYDNENRYWVVEALDDQAIFNNTETISVVSGIGSGDGIVITNQSNSLDDRVLLATVYPTNLNTFGWRLDKDPQFRLLHWSILSNTQYTGSAGILAYNKNKFAILPYIEYVNMGSNVFPLSYKNDMVPYDDFAQHISSNIRLFYKENVDLYEELPENELKYYSFAYQGNKALNTLLSDFYTSRMRINLRNSMDEYNVEALRNTFNNSPAIPTIPDGYFDGMIVFNNYELDSPGASNFDRWMTKGKDLPEYIVNASDDTLEVSRDPFNSSPQYRPYLSQFFISGKERESDAGKLYIPGTLYPTTNPSFEYGLSDLITTYLENSGINVNTLNDIRRRLWEYSFEIPYYNDEHPGFRRKYDYFDFESDDPNHIEYYRTFYGMLFSSFARIFSLNAVNPHEHDIDLLEGLSTAQSVGYEDAYSTYKNSIKSNPISDRYLSLAYSANPHDVKLSKMVGIHDDILDLNLDTDEFIKNYISPYANKLTTRFYNSYKIVLVGDEFANKHDSNNNFVENYDTDRTFESNINSYFTNVVDASDRPQAVDDDHIFIYQDEGGAIRAEDLNYSWTYFDKGHGFRGLGTVITTIQSATASTVKLDANASVIDDFYKGNIITITSGAGNGQKAIITSYNGSTRDAEIDLVIDTSGNSIYDYNDNTPWEVIPSGGDSFNIKTRILDYITANGQQYIFKKSFYDSKSSKVYIRLKMKFVFSKKMGKWAVLDYRQYPITYLTPTFGNEALSYKEKSSVFPGKTGNLQSDYVPININSVNTIENDTYPHNVNTNSFVYDYLWKSQSNCLENPNLIPYYSHKPMELNRFCIPFLSKKLPYDSNGKLLEFISKWKQEDSDFSELYELDYSPDQFEDYSVDSGIGADYSHISTAVINSGNAVGTWVSTDSNGILRRNNTTGAWTAFPNYISLASVPLNRATDIGSDNNGNAYFASLNVVRYNGTSFQKFNGTNAPSLAISLHVDKVNEILYVGTSDGKLYVSDDLSIGTSWTIYTTGLPPLSISDMHKSEDGTGPLWMVHQASNDKRIYKFESGIVTSENVEFLGVTHTKKKSVRVSPNGDVFVAGVQEPSQPKISRRDNLTGNWYVFYIQSNLTTTNSAVRIDSNGTVFISTSRGLYKYISDGVFEVYNESNGLEFSLDYLSFAPPHDYVYSLDIDENNNIWLGGRGGVVYYRRFAAVDVSDYNLNKLANPENDPSDLVQPGINFIVPNNVHGGKISPNRDLFLFHPHLFRVYWHMRPVVSAYSGTDIPSPTERTGGDISDPTLGNMFDFPSLETQEFIIPWHKDMTKNWLSNGEPVDIIITENEETDDEIVENEETDTEITEN